MCITGSESHWRSASNRNLSVIFVWHIKRYCPAMTAGMRDVDTDQVSGKETEECPREIMRLIIIILVIIIIDKRKCKWIAKFTKAEIIKGN